MTILWPHKIQACWSLPANTTPGDKTPRTDLHLTVDEGDAGWTGQTGLITQLLQKVGPSPENRLWSYVAHPS